MGDLIRDLRAAGWRHAWVVDTEYTGVDGELQRPICLCGLDLLTRERREAWLADGYTPCPFEMRDGELFILYAADADILTFIAMGWPVPTNVLATDRGADNPRP